LGPVLVIADAPLPVVIDQGALTAGNSQQHRYRLVFAYLAGGERVLGKEMAVSQSTDPAKAKLANGPLPLTGVRVVDFTWNVAGPTCTKLLAALGADVIKIEYPTMPDPGRRLGGSAGGFFASVNLGKRSITINAKAPAGKRLFERLIGASQVVVESFSAGTLASWGFGFEKLIALSPRVIYVSVTGFGHTTDYQKYVTYGPTAQAYSGLTYSSGLPAQAPAGWGYSHLDVFTGYQAAISTLAAIYDVQHRGGGPTRIDMSQVEVGVGLMSDQVLDAQVNRTNSRRGGFPPGNRAVWPGDTVSGGARGEVGAPYGIYRTAGDSKDAYCAIAVLTDQEWLRLRSCMGDPAWAMADGYLSATGRIAAQDELDAGLSQWTARYDKYELMQMLTSAGVRCGAVQSGRDRLESDPSLRARDVFPQLDLREIGEFRFEGIPIRIGGQPLQPPSTWPILGNDTAAVLDEVLGLDADEIAELADTGVTWPVEG
jgi:crotonobetainyl-CoA:carnitine CoA-transferase CaiB-like acyl-CoA transferase